MLDRLYLPFLGLAAIGAVALAMVGHPPVQRSPAMQAAMKRETEASQRRLNQARDAVRDLQSQAIAPSQ